jgi:hypothetical protein
MDVYHVDHVFPIAVSFWEEPFYNNLTLLTGRFDNNLDVAV